jgi:hypothetical protein
MGVYMYHHSFKRARTHGEKEDVLEGRKRHHAIRETKRRGEAHEIGKTHHRLKRN